MGRFKWIASALVLGVGLALPAQAALVIVNFTGIITQGTDTSGYFTGTPNTDLTTQGGVGGPPGPDDTLPLITGSFSYDTDAFPPDLSGFYGGFTDWLDVSVTIAGTTYSFESVPGDTYDYQTLLIANDDPVYDDRFGLVMLRDGADGSEQITLDLELEEFLTSNDLPAAFTYKSDSGGKGFFYLTTSFVTADANFTITCASSEIPCPLPDVGPAVPEPAVWVNLILGFGLIGAFIRRRRSPLPIAT